MSQQAPIQFAFFRGPIDDPSTPAVVFEAIGRAATAWARLEQHIDAVIFHINKKAHSEQLYREHPISFEGKIKMLKVWFNKHPALASHADDIRILTSRLKILSKESRNPLLHSIFSEYDPATNTLYFQNIKSEGRDTFRIRRLTLPLVGVVALAEVINSANRYLGAISRDLFSPDGIRRFQKP